MEVAEEEEEEDAAEDDFVGVSAPFTRIICGDCGGDRDSGRCLVDGCSGDWGEDCDCLEAELRRGRGEVCSRVVRGECRRGEVRGGVRAPSPSPATSCSATPCSFSAEARCIACNIAGLLMIRVSWWRGEATIASCACVLLMRKGRRR